MVERQKYNHKQTNTQINLKNCLSLYFPFFTIYNYLLPSPSLNLCLRHQQQLEPSPVPQRRHQKSTESNCREEVA